MLRTSSGNCGPTGCGNVVEFVLETRNEKRDTTTTRVAHANIKVDSALTLILSRREQILYPISTCNILLNPFPVLNLVRCIQLLFDVAYA